MATVLDAQTEGGFIFSSVMEWFKCWESNTNSRLILDTYNGQAFLSFGCFLGAPWETHYQRVRVKSKKKKERDNLRAEAFQARKKKEEGERQPSATSSPAPAATTPAPSDVPIQASASLLRDDGPSAEALSSVQAVVSDSKSTIKDNDDESTDQIFQFRDPVSEQSLSSDNFQEESEVSPVSSVSPIRTPLQNITFRVQHSATKDSDSLLTRLKKQYGIATIE